MSKKWLVVGKPLQSEEWSSCLLKTMLCICFSMVGHCIVYWRSLGNTERRAGCPSLCWLLIDRCFLALAILLGEDLVHLSTTEKLVSRSLVWIFNLSFFFAQNNVMNSAYPFAPTLFSLFTVLSPSFLLKGKGLEYILITTAIYLTLKNFSVRNCEESFIVTGLG